MARASGGKIQKRSTSAVQAGATLWGRSQRGRDFLRGNSQSRTRPREIERGSRAGLEVGITENGETPGPGHAGSGRPRRSLDWSLGALGLCREV